MAFLKPVQLTQVGTWNHFRRGNKILWYTFSKRQPKKVWYNHAHDSRSTVMRPSGRDQKQSLITWWKDCFYTLNSEQFDLFDLFADSKVVDWGNQTTGSQRPRRRLWSSVIVVGRAASLASLNELWNNYCRPPDSVLNHFRSEFSVNSGLICIVFVSSTLLERKQSIGRWSNDWKLTRSSDQVNSMSQNVRKDILVSVYWV